MVDVRELWRYRDLLYFFVWRDLKIRYKETSLGIAWAVLQPLLAMLIFTVLFGRLARFPSDGVPYAVFAYTGLLPWTFFANAVSAGGQSLLGNAHLITKVYFPRILIPIAAVATGLIDLAFGFMLTPVLMAYEGIALSSRAVIWIPVVMIASLLLVWGIALWVSALVVRFRDLRHVIPFLLQLWLFVTPVVYPRSMIPAPYRPLMHLNPVAPIVEAFRGALVGHPIDGTNLVLATAIGMALVVTGALYFRQLERTLADTI